MSISWDLLGPPVDVGAHFQAGLERGRAVRKRSETESALAAYGRNPDDPAAQSALFAADPDTAYKFSQQRYQQDQQRLLGEQRQQKTDADAADRRQQSIIKGAQLVRQMKPQDQEGWDRTRAAAQQFGIDVSGVPEQFDPQYVQQLTAAADAFEPVKSEQATAFQRDYEFLNSKDPNLGAEFLRNKAERDPMIASNGDGTFTIIPRDGGMGGAGEDAPPAAAVDMLRKDPSLQSAFDEKYGSGAAARSLGGQTPPASGNFP